MKDYKLEICYLNDTVDFSQSSSLFEGILSRMAKDGWTCSNLVVLENYKVSCSDTEKNETFDVKKSTVEWKEQIPTL